MPDPRKIYQATLDALSAAVLQGDVAVARQLIKLPWTVRTLTATLVIDTDAALVAGLLTYTATLQAQRVTDYIRIVRSADYLSPEAIAGSHTTHTLRGAVVVVPPYENRMVLHLDRGDWRVVVADHDMVNDRWPIHWVRLPTPETTTGNT